MKSSILALIALVALGSGIAASSVAGFGPLAYISYHIITAQEQNANITIIPANINLGNLTPGMKGNVTVNATITLSKSDNYTVMLLHVEKLRKAFSEFKVMISLGNETFNVSLDKPYHVLYLQNGTYHVYVTIFYKVSNNPKGDLNVNNEPLLIIHPGIAHDHHDHDHDNGNHDNGNQGKDQDNENESS
ncbi:hypothetical protein GWK48_08000 [Metallosphaera tengchongensis]|uniref:Uncharacterized protein n=1 Tax=Metallosphaera tengchongensis TaxID=1532350 RepID=A0A6N0NVT1_9CREN|nr:hypothetical protein [Metallosphaera tengchongensis]QKR00325.1 hypothetical protein GWK48_08000 [Metallosphaera tengchongensis]